MSCSRQENVEATRSSAQLTLQVQPGSGSPLHSLPRVNPNSIVLHSTTTTSAPNSVAASTSTGSTSRGVFNGGVDNVALRTRSRCSKRKREVPSNSQRHTQQPPRQQSQQQQTPMPNSSNNDSRLPRSPFSSFSQPCVDTKITRKKSRQRAATTTASSENLACSHGDRGEDSVNSTRRDLAKCKTRKTSPLHKINAKGTLVESLPSQECGVCFEPVKHRGRLDTCEHMYCFSCIFTWAQRASSCPQCKRDISLISKTDVSGKVVTSIHQVKKRSLSDTLNREEYLAQRDEMNERRGFVFRPPAHFQHSYRMQGNTMNRQRNTLTQQLLTFHQMIWDNMTRVTTSLRGIQANLSNLTFLNVNGSVLPQQISFCNFPTFAANINVTVNGAPVGQPTNVALSGYSVVDNTDYLPNPFFRYHAPTSTNNGPAAGGNMAPQVNWNHMTQVRQQVQQVQQLQQMNQLPLNFSLPSSMLPPAGLFSQEVTRSLEMLSRIGQNRLQMAAVQAANGQQQQRLPTYAPRNHMPGQR